MTTNHNNDIRLRAPEPADVDMLYRLENHPQVWQVSWGSAPVSRQMIWDYVQSYSADIYRDKQLRLVIEADGKCAGCLDITDLDPANGRAMVGIALEEDMQGRGIARRALEQAIDYCRADLGLHQLAAIVPRDNGRSLRLFAAAGFATCGCLRSWLRRGRSYVDALVVQKLL